jgi:hypothetical protein
MPNIAAGLTKSDRVYFVPNTVFLSKNSLHVGLKLGQRFSRIPGIINARFEPFEGSNSGMPNFSPTANIYHIYACNQTLFPCAGKSFNSFSIILKRISHSGLPESMVIEAEQGQSDDG